MSLGIPITNYIESKHMYDIDANEGVKKTLELKSHEERVKEIIIATVSAVACAVFVALAALSFVALAGALAVGSIFVMGAFLPLALGVASTIAAIALAVIATKKSIDAHRNLPPVESKTSEEKTAVKPEPIIPGTPASSEAKT